MTRFIQSLSKLWWILLLIFLLHQFFEKCLGWNLPFLNSYLDPFLSMPILLGIQLAERRHFFKEKGPYSIPAFEIAVISIFAASVFEFGLPRWVDGFVCDPWDFLAYGLGALFFDIFMNSKKKQIG